MMNIFAVIKKAVNSNLNKPLNVTLDEIQGIVSKKCRRVVVNKLGAPYNETNDSQVLTENDAPFISVNGSGRILTVVPIYSDSATSTLYGTALITVDGEILINNQIEYATKNSSNAGKFLIDTVESRKVNSFGSDVSGTRADYYANAPIYQIGNAVGFSKSKYGIFAPSGVPFANSFEIRMTQKVASTNEKLGVIVVYELYE